MILNNIRRYFEDEDELLDIYYSFLQDGYSNRQAACAIAENVGVCSGTITRFLQFLGAYEHKKAQPVLRSYEQYCREDPSLIENYEAAKADEFKGWVIHHRLQTHKYKDRTRTEWIERDESVPRDWLKALGLYYNRPAAELIFLTNAEHLALHNRDIGKRHRLSEALKNKPKSEEHKQALREAWERRKTRGPVSEETKRKMSEARAKYWEQASQMYKQYKADGGTLSWREWRKSQ